MDRVTDRRGGEETNPNAATRRSESVDGARFPRWGTLLVPAPPLVPSTSPTQFDSPTVPPPTVPPTAATPRWMRSWLIGAGVYNLLWGAVVVLAPAWTLAKLGVLPTIGEPTPVEASLLGATANIWACVGMIVGVYGVGYLAAARDPLRHWPIVLVGLLGKIFGPIGFLLAATRGDLPWSMGWTLLTNDLLWWIPFGVILMRAARVHRSQAS